MTSERLTAPLWAQAIGLRTRNQALQFQARAMGFRNRGEMERTRAGIFDIVREGSRAEESRVTRASARNLAREWRQLLESQRKAEIAVKNDDDDAQKLVAKAQAQQAALNRRLPERLRIGSPRP